MQYVNMFISTAVCREHICVHDIFSYGTETELMHSSTSV